MPEEKPRPNPAKSETAVDSECRTEICKGGTETTQAAAVRDQDLGQGQAHAFYMTKDNGFKEKKDLTDQGMGDDDTFLEEREDRDGGDGDSNQVPRDSQVSLRSGRAYRRSLPCVRHGLVSDDEPCLRHFAFRFAPQWGSGRA